MARCRKEWYLYISLFVILTKIYSILATARFTQFPPNVSYVSSGGTARFVWDYHVDNRLWEFLSESPVWYFINQATHSESIIGADDRETNNWSFVINEATCPPRLLNPDRVSRESNATLVITDVTIADNGIYKCSLKLKSDQAIDHQLQLVVTVRPTFLPSHPNNTYQIIEGQDLKINCTAIGRPTPDITWVNITDGSVDIKSQGSGSAVLQIDNIRRYHAGVYECQARNNPNEAATTTRTSVTIYYPPVITATPNAVGCIGGKLQLVCKADGLPKPTMILKDSSGNELSNSIGKGEISLSIEVKNSSQFDNYTCIAKNYLGNASHVIFSKEESCPSPTPNPGTGSKVPAGVIAGVAIAGILAIAGLVIALIFCYRRKTLEKDSGRSGVRQERTVQMSSLPDHEDHYASVQHNQDNQGTPTAEPVLQYAKVDKTKKKRHNPDELVYADLALDAKDDFGSRPVSTRHPTNESDTVYADIAGNRKNPEPQYGNLQGRDIVI